MRSVKRGLISAVLVVAVILGGTGWASDASPHSSESRRVLGSARSLLLGRSEQGRPIVAWRVGDAHDLRVLVVGCIHGNEGAGIAVVRASSPNLPAKAVVTLPPLPKLVSRLPAAEPAALASGSAESVAPEPGVPGLARH